MKLKRGLTLLMVVVICISIVGCTINSSEEKIKTDEADLSKTLKEGEIMLYYINNDKTEIGPVIKKLNMEKYSEKFTISEVVMFLQQAPGKQGYGPSISESVNVILVTYDDTQKSAVVDFDDGIEALSNNELLLLRTSLVLSLSNLPFVNQVKMTVGGKPLLDPNGQTIGFQRASDFVLQSEEFLYTPEKYDVTLYFANKDEEKLITEKRTVQVVAGRSLPEIVINELISGPKNEELVRTIPQGTKVIDVTEKNGICYVGLSSDFLRSQSSSTSKDLMIVYSIVNSLTDLRTINQVKFDIDGDSIKKYRSIEGFDKPLSRNLDIVEK